MNDYDVIRHFADSYGLLAMVVMFLAFGLWLFRPGARHHYDEAAIMIFGDEGEAADSSRETKSHG